MGYSRLQAVNEIARACGEMRFSALDSSGSWPSKSYGSSFAGEAEFILDMTARAVLSRGWEANVVRSKKYTLGSPGALSFASNVLNAIAAGPTQRRLFVFRNGAAYDLEGDTATFATGDYFFDIITDHDFDTLPVDLQVLIIREAKSEAQGKLKGDPNRQALIEGEVAKAEVSAMRSTALNSRPINAQALVPQQPRSA
jgi:hypothetical protein